MEINKIVAFFKDERGYSKVSILKNQRFYIGLLLKVVLLFLFAGSPLVEKYIPFISYFTETGNNPYRHFFNLGVIDAFPFPPLMLLLFAAVIPLKIVAFGLLKLPLLIADFLILIILGRLLKGKENQILLYYWLSPVLIFITYIHTQLDAVPIALMFVSFYFLFKKKYTIASLFLGLVITTSFNFVLVIPFFLIYVWKEIHENKLKHILKSLFITTATVGILNLPFIISDSNALIQLVYNTGEQAMVWGVKWKFSQYEYFIIPALYLILLVGSWNFKIFSKDLFLLFLGFSFSVFLIFIPPKPGWFFWVLPFFIFFYIKDGSLPKFLFWALQVAFLLYFSVAVNSPVGKSFLFRSGDFSVYRWMYEMGLNPKFFVSLAFTFMQTMLILNIYYLFVNGVRAKAEEKFWGVPFLIGIGGDSGAGKTTLTSIFKNLFGQSNIQVVKGDDMHKWERGDVHWKENTHLSPEANHLHQEVKYLKDLKSGITIYRRHYSHETGKFTEPIKIKHKKLIIYEGLHPFYIAAKRTLFDLKIFVEAEDKLRYHWKITRDSKKRDKSKEQVIEQLKYREKDSKKYISSQAQHADIKIKYISKETVPTENQTQSNLGATLEFDTNIDFSNFVGYLKEFPSLTITHQYEEHSQQITAFGDIPSEQIELAVYELVDNYDDYIINTHFEKDLKGFLQLFFLYYITIQIK